MTATSRRSFVRSARKSARSSVRSLFQTRGSKQTAGSDSSSDSESSTSCSSLDRKNANSTTLSSSSARGAKALSLLPSYLADARGVVKYHATEEPQGALSLGVAESKLVEDLLLPRLQQAPQTLTADSIYYQPTSGRDDLKAAFLQYMKELVENDHLKPENLVLGSGCNAVLENLCFAIADPGDTVLIPTPYYAAFEFDLAARAGLRVQGFHPSPTSGGRYSTAQPEYYYPTPDSLDTAYERCLKETGRPPRILLISHPQNPLGICYTESVVRDCMNWCNERQVHLISDEIYAGSVHSGDSTTFKSALTIAGANLGPYVHWVYAMSKDFAMSGLRIGALYTENAPALAALQKLNDMCQISSQTQVWTKELLLARSSSVSESWTSAFRTENHARLQARAQRVTSILDTYQVPYLPPTAGLFVWIDLSQFLTPSTPDPERALYLSLIADYGLLLTPGQSMRFARPGFFRCVFTAATDAEFEIALERLENMCQGKKMMK